MGEFLSQKGKRINILTDWARCFRGAKAGSPTFQNDGVGRGRKRGTTQKEEKRKRKSLRSLVRLEWGISPGKYVEI